MIHVREETLKPLDFPFARGGGDAGDRLMMSCWIISDLQIHFL